MSRVQRIDHDLLDMLARRVKEFDARLLKVENNKVPTYPRIDPIDLPAGGVDGQIIVGHDDFLYTRWNENWQDAF